MSKKFKLFASVASPLVALPLMIQSASAMPPKISLDQAPMPGVIHVQQQVIVPGEDGAEKPSRRQSQGAGEGEEQQRPRQKQSQGEAEQPRAPRGAQASDSEQEPAQRPRRQQQAEPEATPRRAQQADKPDADAPNPRAQRQQPAKETQGETQGETQQPRRDKQRQEKANGSNAGSPAATETQSETQQPRRDKQRQEKSGSDAGTPAATETEQPPRGNANQQRRNQDNKRTDPAANGSQPDASRSDAPATRPLAGEAPDPDAKPGRPSRRGTEAQETAPAGDAAPGSRRQQPGSDGQTEGARPGRDATRQQVAPADAEQPARRGATETDAPATGRPSRGTAAQGDQPVLPVENGAPVLDSAKQAPRGADGEQRPRRQRPEQADQQPAERPKSDADAQRNTRATREQQQEFRQLTEERGERLDRRPEFERPRGWDFRGPAGRDRDRDDGRVIISIDNQPVVRHDDSRRFYDERGGRRPEYERLGDDRVREVIVRDDGTRIITVRNRYGEIVQRSRVVRGGEEYVLYSAPELLDGRRGRDYEWRDPGEDLPPMRLSVPVDEYIIDTSSEPDRDYYEFLEQPPVEQVERVYSLDEVRYSARIRDKVPRIDLDTITFATGSAEIPMNQAGSLRKVADAINKVLERDPSETFLIEGHTDAVGADQDNLVLSDERAESVARVLTDAFNIPPENLTTQGYGEQYLKVKTDGPNQENRRVTIRRITPLVKPLASKQ